ncbi:MAG: response regulator [Nitrospirota bacterium]
MSEIKFSILIVDDEAGNRQMLRQILKGKYRLFFAADGMAALEIAAQNKPDLILLDIMMPGIDGYETCRRLKANAETASNPVIFITALADVGDEAQGFEAGGVDYITKPVSAPVVLHRVSAHLEIYHNKLLAEETIQIRTKQLSDSQKSAVIMLGEAGHYNDTDTGSHVWRMAAYCGEIARACGWSAKMLECMELASVMHDVGKLGIPGTILRKPGKLDPEEWKIMETHTTIGYNILSKSNTHLFEMAATVAHYHHEKWNGGGYPKGLKGDEIPECAAIVAVADVFDALTMTRPYKAPWPVEKAIEEIKKGSGTHFSPYIVECFFKSLDMIMIIKTSWDEKEQGGAS